MFSHILNFFKKYFKNSSRDTIASPEGHAGGRDRRIVTILSILLIIVVGLAFYFWNQTRVLTSTSISGGNDLSQSEIEGLISKVGTLMFLPSDEVPTLATVSDPEKLKDQPFFAQAKVGDKVLIYAKSQKAILYDPVANKIVNVAPINLGGQSGTIP